MTKALEVAVPTPMALLETAIAKGVDIEQLTKLMDLHERFEATRAKKFYVAAMAAFKADAPKILKDKSVSYKTARGTTSYEHASLPQVCAAITAGLSKQGLSHSWETAQPEKGRIQVTCVITHEEGHSERTPLVAPYDDSGGKNAIQSLGSSVTYLQRYTLLAATGLAAGGTDDDGQAAGKRTIDRKEGVPKKTLEEFPEPPEPAPKAKEAKPKSLLHIPGKKLPEPTPGPLTDTSPSETSDWMWMGKTITSRKHDVESAKKWIYDKFNVDSYKKLTKGQVRQVVMDLQKMDVIQ